MIQLVIDEYNQLSLPDEDNSLLWCTDAFGDIHTIEATAINRHHLRRALYDARECGFIPHEPIVLLPSGEAFDIDGSEDTPEYTPEEQAELRNRRLYGSY